MAQILHVNVIEIKNNGHFTPISVNVMTALLVENHPHTGVPTENHLHAGVPTENHPHAGVPTENHPHVGVPTDNHHYAENPLRTTLMWDAIV